MTIYEDRAGRSVRITDADMQSWLRGGLNREDGRLALFDQFGEPIEKDIVRSAIASGLAQPWFSSPMRPQWTVCRLTPKGRAALDRPARTR